MTFSQISASGTEQGIGLKAASNGAAALKVVYYASTNVVKVLTYTTAQGWVQRGSDISVTMNNGDQFGARAKADGTVEVYRNGSLLGTVDVTAWAPYSGGGYIGSWYSNTSGAIVDDFGGGNVSASATATPTNTSTPTQTNTPSLTPTITNTPTITETPTLTLTPSDTPIPSDTPTVTLTPSQTFTPSFTPTLTNIPTFTPTPGQPPAGPVTITYEYDPLYRLTEANYSTGDYYHYTYDAVGNRLTQETLIGSVPLTTNYVYDAANRLTSVDSVAYTWDNNGNLLNDGVNTYAYDSANRLTSISGGQTATYAYNGLGDRLSQNGVNYTLDLNAGLTQVLNDGTNQYLYGVGRITQVNTTTLITDYFMTDALGSVRQLTDAQGEITLANAYEPYGVLAQTAGSAQTNYGFTGEFTDPSGMVYLRARYYSPTIGRFQTRDTWMGDYNSPLSLNRWNYTLSNPINYVDPSGYIAETEAPEANSIVQRLRVHQVNIAVDWGMQYNNYYWVDPVDNRLKTGTTCYWQNGLWSINELRDVEASVVIIIRGVRSLGGNPVALWGPIPIKRENGNRSGAPDGQIKLRDDILDASRRPYIIIHEIGHIVSYYNPDSVVFFLNELGAECVNSNSPTYCNSEDNNGTYRPGPYAGLNNQNLPSANAAIGSWEDYAETFTVVVSEAYIRSKDKEYNNIAKLVYNQPSLNSDIGRRRKVMKAILRGIWRQP